MVDPVSDKNMERMAEFAGRVLMMGLVLCVATIIGITIHLITPDTNNFTNQPTEDNHG